MRLTANFNPVPVPDELRAPPIPGYGPFNIQRIGRRLYVTYAKQDKVSPRRRRRGRAMDSILSSAWTDI